MTGALRIGVIAGEESGDLLAADLMVALQAKSGRPVELVGVGGRHLQSLGLKSLFNADDLALMGFSAVLRDLPRLWSRLKPTAKAIAAAKPDCLVTIDSPEFTLRVAKRLRALAPDIPIIHYVCPSVWAWRPGRAKEMQPYVDRILCILPFEPAALAELGGPPGVYVGHRLTRDSGVLMTARLQKIERDLSPLREKTLVVLPGSRRGEVRSLAGPFGEVVSILKQRGHRLRLLLPTVPHVSGMIALATRDWVQQPEILTSPSEKWRAFGEADAAMAASGTVGLELALGGTPFISAYQLDPIGRMFAGLVKTWSASLPNLIADRVLVLEYINAMLRPQHMARTLETLFDDATYRQWQKSGFDHVRQVMATDRPPGEAAADAVLQLIAKPQ